MNWQYRHLHRCVLILGALGLLAASTGAALDLPQQPANYVVDLADLVDAQTESRLNDYLRILETKTSAQVVVLTIPSLEGRTLETLSLEVAHDRWKLGQQGKDNGVLILVAAQDRKYRFEVGYGLEGVLPDSLVGRIGREHLVPHFRQGDYARGLALGTMAVAKAIATDAGVQLGGMPAIAAQPSTEARSHQGTSRPLPLSRVVVGFAVIAFCLFSLLYFVWFIGQRSKSLLHSGRRVGGGGFSGGVGGGGFSGGVGGGGFSGGGGSFGGGGASGGW